MLNPLGGHQRRAQRVASRAIGFRVSAPDCTSLTLVEIECSAFAIIGLSGGLGSLAGQ